MKLQYFRTIIFYPDLSRYKNFSIFASSKQPQTSMGKTDDSGFVNGLRTGDAEAWRHLFVRYYAVYLRFVTKIVGDANSAKDIVQEVFMKLWKNRDRLDSVASVEKLLYVIARNSAFTFLRDRKSFAQVEESKIEDKTMLSVEEELLRQERRKMLDDAVKTLPKQRKTVIDMKMEGETNRSISEELKLSEKTVERHITLALSELKTKFRS